MRYAANGLQRATLSAFPSQVINGNFDDNSSWEARRNLTNGSVQMGLLRSSLSPNPAPSRAWEVLTVLHALMLDRYHKQFMLEAISGSNLIGGKPGKPIPMSTILSAKTFK